MSGKQERPSFSDLNLTAKQKRELATIAATFRRRMQALCDGNASSISISTADDRIIAEFTPKQRAVSDSPKGCE